MSEPKKKGRPTKYRAEYCQQLLEYFDIEPYEELKTTVKSKDGTIKEVTQSVPNDLPLLTKFAKNIGVSRDTLNEWSKRHSAFSDALKKAKDRQKIILIVNSLRGLYNPTFAIFTAKNLIGWRDGNTQSKPTVDPSKKPSSKSNLLSMVKTQVNEVGDDPKAS